MILRGFMVLLERFLWLAVLLVIIALCWLAASPEPYPAAFGPAPGFGGKLVSGDRGGWLPVAPVLAFSAFWASRRREPAAVCLVCGTLAALFSLLFVYWPDLPRFLGGLANVLLAALLFLLLLPVAFAKSLY